MNRLPLSSTEALALASRTYELGIVATTTRQLQSLGLKTRGLSFVAWDEYTLKVGRGARGVLIRYNAGTDLYDIQQYDGMDVRPLADGVYADNLLIAIAEVLR